MTSTSNSLDENDIFSVLSAPVKLIPVETALKAEFPNANIRIYTSGYNGAKTTHLAGVGADVEGYPQSTDGNGEDSDYFLNGAIYGESAAAVAKAQSMFARIADAGMTVQFEVYDPDGNTLIEQKPTRR